MHKKNTYDLKIDAPDENLEEYTYDLPEYKEPEKKTEEEKIDRDELEIQKLETMSEKELDMELANGKHMEEDDADIIKLVILGVFLILALAATIYAGKVFFNWFKERSDSQPPVSETEKVNAGEQEDWIQDTLEQKAGDESAAISEIDAIRTRRQKQEELYTMSYTEGGYTYLATGSNIRVDYFIYETDESGNLMLERVTAEIAGEPSTIEIIYEDETPRYVSVASDSGEWQFYLENREVIRYVNADGTSVDYTISEAINPVYLDRGAAVKFALDQNPEPEVEDPIVITTE